MPGGLRGRSPAAVAVYLAGVIFPASRDDLVACSEEEQAPQEIIDILELLPDREYPSITAVMAVVRDRVG